MLRTTPNGGWVREGRVSPVLVWLWNRRFNPSHGDLGRWGEWIALRHLLAMGWDVVARNWRGRRGEVDLIAWHDSRLVFAEVKTSLLPSPFLPEERVDPEKQRRMERLAYEFIWRHELEEAPVRLDVIAVETRDQVRFRLRHYVL